MSLIDTPEAATLLTPQLAAPRRKQKRSEMRRPGKITGDLRAKYLAAQLAFEALERDHFDSGLVWYDDEEAFKLYRALRQSGADEHLLYDNSLIVDNATGKAYLWRILRESYLLIELAFGLEQNPEINERVRIILDYSQAVRAHREPDLVLSSACEI